MNVNDVYKSTSGFLRAEDLQGKTVRLTIDEAGSHVFNQGQPDEKMQIVLSFVGKEKRLGLNATNARSIAAQLGDETAMWPGKEIKIYPTTTEFGGKEVPCIRVVEEAPPEADYGAIPF